MQISTVVYFLIWAGLFAVMMRFGCGAHVMGHRRRQEQLAGEPGRAPDSTTSEPERGRDPVCGMNVLTAEAKSALHAGRIYYFCSQNCREKFEAAPADYLKGQSLGSTREEHRHGSHC